MKRGINKQSAQKKLIVEEKYNYEEKYEIYKNIVLYYEENRIDYQIAFNKLDRPESGQNSKDITTEFSLNISIPGADDTVAYKKYNGKQEYHSALSGHLPEEDDIEYIVARLGKYGESYMTLYPGRRQSVRCGEKSLRFVASNISQPQKNYINLKIYLEKYKIT